MILKDEFFKINRFHVLFYLLVLFFKTRDFMPANFSFSYEAGNFSLSFSFS